MSVLLHPRILELVASRICHDLVSPVGAINNGVELIRELGPDAGDEAMALVANSAVQASVRLKCFRLLYGAAGTDKNVGFKDIKDVFTDWIQAGRVQAEFAPDLGTAFSAPARGFLKTVLSLLILSEECCRGEGKIFISADGASGVKLLVTGHNISFRDGNEVALKGETDPENLDARSVHAYVTGKFVEYFGLVFSYQAQPDFGRLEFNLSFAS